MKLHKHVVATFWHDVNVELNNCICEMSLCDVPKEKIHEISDVNSQNVLTVNRRVLQMVMDG